MPVYFFIGNDFLDDSEVKNVNNHTIIYIYPIKSPGMIIYIKIGHKNERRIFKRKLKQIIDKICRIEEEKDAINTAIKDTLDEAKSLGFDVKAIKQVIKITKMDDSDVKNKRRKINLHI